LADEVWHEGVIPDDLAAWVWCILAETFANLDFEPKVYAAYSTGLWEGV